MESTTAVPFYWSPEETLSMRDDGLVSELLVDKATRVHSGNYTCEPSNAAAASVLVHVVDGEYELRRGTSPAETWREVHKLLIPLSHFGVLSTPKGERVCLKGKRQSFLPFSTRVCAFSSLGRPSVRPFRLDASFFPFR